MNETFQIQKKPVKSIDALEKFILDELPPALETLTHTHTKGLYGRKWEADAGTIWVTRRHLVDHQFVILKGKVVVWVDGKEIIYEAGYDGITKAGTRRVLYVIEDVCWKTFHPNPDNLGEEEFVELVTEKHNNELFSEEDELLLQSVRSNIEQKYLTV